MIKKNNDNGSRVVKAALAVVFLTIIILGVIFIQRESTKQSCKNNGQIYVESANSCRPKTVSEEFSDKCTGGITIGDRKYTCSDIKNAGLEKAYLYGKIVEHGGDIYEYGTALEVQIGKSLGDYCLSASDTWGHIGEKRCVVFTPARLAYQGYNYFLDEKQDYNNGFVVYMYGNYGWNWFLDTYKDKGPILVCGTITSYQGHPQIKTTPSSTLVSPNATKDGIYTVYKYSCK